jgi:vitamin B12 transporter
MNGKSLLIAVTCSLAAVASSNAGAQAQDTAQLGTVVVSATKVPARAGTLSQAVTVLSGEDLRARGVVRVSDALREVPGATLVQSGSYGAVTSLFLRGGESRYTKVLIDGVPVNAPGGFFDFSHLTMDNIDRIEIVRGPGSVMYGADAVTGIVQIFTRRGSDQGRASLAVRGGTYHSLDFNADALGTTPLGGFSVGAGHHSTSGIIPFNNEYRNGTLSSAFTLAQGTEGDARIAARYTTAEFHYPTDFTGALVDTNSYRVQHRLTVGLDAGRNLAPNIEARLLAGNNDVWDLSEDIAVPFDGTAPRHYASRSRGYRRNVEGRVAFSLPSDATITIGATYEQEHENSSNASGNVGGPTSETDSFDASRHTIAYYSELLGKVTDRLTYTVAGRVDDNSDYRRFDTYRLGVNVAVVPALRIRGSLSTAFNAPAFSQIRPTLFTVGSPNLRPERSRSAEIGLVSNIRPDLVQVSASYFNQRFSDLIQFVNGGPPDFLGSFANLTGATSNGYEAELQLTPLKNWRGTASYTVVNPHVTEVDPAFEGTDRPGDELIRRPTHSGALVVSYSRPWGMSLGTAVSHVGKRPDTDFSQFPSPRVTLPAYTKVDLSAEYALTRLKRGGLTLNARVDNVFDKRYEEVLNFTTPRRTILIGGRASALF